MTEQAHAKLLTKERMMDYKPDDFVGKTWSCYRLIFPNQKEVEIRGFSEQDVREKTNRRFGEAQSVVFVKSLGVVVAAHERNGHMEFQLKDAGSDLAGG